MRQQVVDTFRRMRTLGLVVHTAGNVSMRSPDGMLITPTRVHPDDLRPEQVVALPLCGGTGSPSLEWRLHAAVYCARPDVCAIAHTHSPYAVARSFDPAPLLVATEERDYLALDRIEVAPHAPAGSEALASTVVAALGARGVALLARHGVVGVGETPAEALEMCCVAEHQAQVDYLRATRAAVDQVASTTRATRMRGRHGGSARVLRMSQARPPPRSSPSWLSRLTLSPPTDGS